MNIFRKLYALSVWSEYYRHAAEAVVAKLVDNYDKFSVEQRLKFAKLAVDNIERLKGVLREMMKLKYKPFSQEEYTSIVYALTKIEWSILHKRYGDTRYNSVRRIKEDLTHIVYALDAFRDDVINIILGKKIPIWYTKVPSDKVKKLEREVSELYYKKFKEPLAVFLYL